MMESEEDITQGIIGFGKSTISLIPGIGQVLAGWDAYKKSQFDRAVKKAIETLQALNEQVQGLEDIFQDQWWQSDEGKQFARKVWDAAIDQQFEDKQELFINALVQGGKKKDVAHLEKLKFIDILRSLSRAAIMVLADMHEMFKIQVRGQGRSPESTSGYPLVDPNAIASKLSDRYDPYLVTAAIHEMESQGLFSDIGEWHKDTSGRSRPGGGFNNALCYTDFASRFVEFITIQAD